MSHGAGEHCGRYDELAQMLVGLELLVFAHDHGEYPWGDRARAAGRCLTVWEPPLLSPLLLCYSLVNPAVTLGRDVLHECFWVKKKNHYVNKKKMSDQQFLLSLGLNAG